MLISYLTHRATNMTGVTLDKMAAPMTTNVAPHASPVLSDPMDVRNPELAKYRGLIRDTEIDRTDGRTDVHITSLKHH